MAVTSQDCRAPGQARGKGSSSQFSCLRPGAQRRLRRPMFEEDTTPLWGGPRLYLRAGDTLSLLWGTTRLMKEA